MIISITPNWPFVPSRNRLPNVIAGARAAMNLVAIITPRERKSLRFRITAHYKNHQKSKSLTSGYRRTEEQIQDGRYRFLEVLRHEGIRPIAAVQRRPPPDVESQAPCQLSSKVQRTVILLGGMCDVSGLVTVDGLGLRHDEAIRDVCRKR